MSDDFRPFAANIHGGYIDDEGRHVGVFIWPSDRGPLTINRRVSVAPEGTIAGLLDALGPLAFCDAACPPPGVESDPWRAAVIAARKARAAATGAT